MLFFWYCHSLSSLCALTLTWSEVFFLRWTICLEQFPLQNQGIKHIIFIWNLTSSSYPVDCGGDAGLFWLFWFFAMCSIWRNSTQKSTLISLNTLFVNLCSTTARQFCHSHLYQVFLMWVKFSPFCVKNKILKKSLPYPSLTREGALTFASFHHLQTVALWLTSLLTFARSPIPLVNQGGAHSGLGDEQGPEVSVWRGAVLLYRLLHPQSLECHGVPLPMSGRVWCLYGKSETQSLESHWITLPVSGQVWCLCGKSRTRSLESHWITLPMSGWVWCLYGKSRTRSLESHWITLLMSGWVWCLYGKLWSITWTRSLKSHWITLPMSGWIVSTWQVVMMHMNTIS